MNYKNIGHYRVHLAGLLLARRLMIYFGDRIEFSFLLALFGYKYGESASDDSSNNSYSFIFAFDLRTKGSSF